MIWLLSATFVGAVIGHTMHRRFRLSICSPIALIPSVLSCVLLLRAFDDPIAMIKGLLFAESLIVVGISDGLTHEIPNILLLPIFAAGLLNFQPVPAIEGFFAVSCAFLFASAVTKGGIGGGDIKLISAAGFVLGPFGAICGALIGMTAFLAGFSLFRNSSEKKFRYAMAPWLGAGCFFAYCLIPSGGI